MRPRLLDLFCGAGGAATGYHRAGFDVVGVDIRPQPNYPFEFVQADALEFLEFGADVADRWYGAGAQKFDAIHASPPCQAFTKYRNHGRVGDYPDLIRQTRELLDDTGLPYVIENVEGAPLHAPVLICGSMFDPPMDIRRHRLFEANWDLRPAMWPCRHKLQAVKRFPGGRSVEQGGSSRHPARMTVEVGTWDIPLAVQQEAMGIYWMGLEELSEAIPPAYTELIGHQLMAHVQANCQDADTKQGSFPGQAASAAPGITVAEQRTGGAAGQGRGLLAADRNASAAPPSWFDSANTSSHPRGDA